jgi:hypothetical protein
VEKKRATQGGGFERPGWQSSPGEEKLLYVLQRSSNYIDDGLF